MSDRVWLITGASRGIGADIARAVLSCGDKLVATARHSAGLAHLGVSDDLLVRLAGRDRRKAVGATPLSAALDRFGKIDILVNNAGLCLLGAVEETERGAG